MVSYHGPRESAELTSLEAAYDCSGTRLQFQQLCTLDAGNFRLAYHRNDATVFAHQAFCAAADEPAAMTSTGGLRLPGMALPTRFFNGAPMNLAGRSALMTGRSGATGCLAVVISARLNIPRPRSDGLIGSGFDCGMT